jgi:choline dehydrogenase-like flavoprotein
VRAPGGGVRLLEADTFVLAAGTIETARLLLTAAATPGNCPWRENTNVGAYFKDHLGGRVAAVHPEDSRVFFECFSTIARGGAKYEPKIRLRNEVLERERIVNVQGMFTFEGSASHHLIYLKQFLKAAVFSRRISGVGDFFRNAVGSARHLLPLMWRYVWDHRIFIPSSSKISLFAQAEQVPCVNSRIRIDPNATDSIGLPRVLLDWRLCGADELASIRTFTIRVSDAFRAAGLGRVQIDESLLALRPSFVSTLSDTIHQSGGAVMGPSELDGVVDRNLRVFGTENLYVGGSSTFRTISSANTTFTALAFATRLAGHLSGGRRC